MANNKEYKEYSKGACPAMSENTNTSIRAAKVDRFVLDNNMNWYVFEDNLLMGIDYLDRYRNTLLRMSTRIKIGKDYFMRPEYVSHKLYGTTDLWYILLWLNDMKNPTEFVKEEILVIATNKVNELQKLMDNARKFLHNVVNPVHIHKHYLKHPKLPSENIIPNSYNEKIYDCGFVEYESKPFINNLEYLHNYNDYYHGKSKMTEIIENKITKVYNELSIRYMDGIQISNNTYDPIYENTQEERQYKFTGYMYFPYQGIYDFQLNGINGTASLIIDGHNCVNNNGDHIVKLPEINKEFDFFELKTGNSDFKKRNWSGWTYHDKKVRLVTDPIKRKPVAKTIVDNNFFNVTIEEVEHKILDIVGNEIISKDIENIEYKLDNNDSSTVVSNIDKLGLLFYNKMSADELNINLEPYNDGKDGKIIFTCELLAKNVENVEIQPYIKINYTDSTSDKSILNHYNIGSLWSANEYETLIVSVNIDKEKSVSTIEFGVLCEKYNMYDKCKAEISINQVAINLTEFNGVSCEIKEHQKGKWLPFICNYTYNGNKLKMFYIKRRANIFLDPNLDYIIDKERDLITDKDGNFIIALRNEFSITDSTEGFSLIGKYNLIDKEQIAIVPKVNENSFAESVLVTISSKTNREACYLQHSINKKIVIDSEDDCVVSYKTCLMVENNKNQYKLQLDTNENVEIYLDNMAMPVSSGYGNIFYFSPVDNEANRSEISISGYRLANLEIYIKNTANKEIKTSLFINERNVFKEVNDVYFVVRPQKLFKYLRSENISLEEQSSFLNSDDTNILDIFFDENYECEYNRGYKPKIENNNIVINNETQMVEFEEEYDGGWVASQNYLQVTPGETYTISVNGTNIWVAEYQNIGDDNNPVYKCIFKQYEPSTKAPTKFTFIPKGNFIRVGFYSSTLGSPDDYASIFVDSKKRDVISIESNNKYRYLNVFKPGIITIKELIENRDCNNYVMEFYIRIKSDQNGQFVINLDEQANENKYGLILNYETTFSDDPNFNLENGLYTNTSESLENLSNIDNGIDFYKHKFEEIPVYSNMVDVSSSLALKKFTFNKNRVYYVKIKKKKNYISLQIDGQYIAVWHDYEKAYTNGLCGFTFINLNNVEITELNIHC